MSQRNHAAQVLSGAALARRVREIADGEDVRCAIPFFSVDGIKHMFANGIPADAKILCDVSMGGTSEAALRELSSVLKDRLRHAPEMHAKM